MADIPIPEEYVYHTNKDALQLLKDCEERASLYACILIITGVNEQDGMGRTQWVGNGTMRDYQIMLDTVKHKLGLDGWQTYPWLWGLWGIIIGAGGARLFL